MEIQQKTKEETRRRDLKEAIRTQMSRSHSLLLLSQTEITRLLELFPQGLVAVDLETTGLSPLVDKIIEIAAVKITPSTSEKSVEYFHSLVNPLIDIPPITTEFHGLKNEDLKEAPTIKKPLKEFWEFAGRYPVIAHNSSFDLGYLIKASHDFQLEFPPLDVFDSCRWARAVYKNHPTPPKNFKLSTLSSFFNFQLLHHVAIEDAYACLKIMAAMPGEDFNEIQKKKIKEKSFVFRLSQFNRNDCFNFSSRLKLLAKMVQEKNLLVIEYRGSSPLTKEKKRPIRPIGLMPLPKGPVLFAECLLSGMNKSFSLKKIKSFTKLEASYLRQGDR